MGGYCFQHHKLNPSVKQLKFLLCIITVYARAAEGEPVPTIAVEGRVNSGHIEEEIVGITKIRRISLCRPSKTEATRIPQTTVIDISAAKNITLFLMKNNIFNKIA